ncbi:unnamed protein product [Rotaria socialis]|uniref:Uncharacterized protein n=1 Tax=Rotaria socialis TaxID=392032 RepID=A0A817WQV7_9BILA|nr:unnamed protein product [Rotaria socialis]CAF3699467.1 unnamed protein product [Rotaria socialis]CAF4448488.1 unnamed protein product [Rotaria socialis]CAF4520994.1 unnamed protein product [Rotaria socialis]CAF4611825.1 unnamed protein product [Rotaria socialis]
MIARGHVQEIYSSVEKLMNQYRLEKKYSTSFINLYRTLSEVIHNSSLPYEDDKLPIPDLSEGQFSRSDALALASFYKIALPNIEYEFVTNIVHFSSDSANLFNRINLNNSMNICHTTMNATNEQSLKRKLSDGNQENEIQ